MTDEPKPLTDNANGFYTPLCCKCDKEAVWQIGTYIPFKSKAVFFCDEHISDGLRRAALEQENQRLRVLLDRCRRYFDPGWEDDLMQSIWEELGTPDEDKLPGYKK